MPLAFRCFRATAPVKLLVSCKALDRLEGDGMSIGGID